MGMKDLVAQGRHSAGREETERRTGAVPAALRHLPPNSAICLPSFSLRPGRAAGDLRRPRVACVSEGEIADFKAHIPERLSR